MKPCHFDGGSCGMGGYCQDCHQMKIGGHRYPSTDEIEADLNNETVAITVAVATMADALEACPLDDSLKVHAAIELAFKYGDRKYVWEVFREITLRMGGPDGG